MCVNIFFFFNKQIADSSLSIIHIGAEIKVKMN